jgi:hypothetical protein
MRGKLTVAVGAAVFWIKSQGLMVEGGQTSADRERSAASTVRRSMAWIVGAFAAVMASSALPQGNIDAGKSPAQMFADTCSNCHRRPQELKRASASFLRQHYTPGAQEAAAMASYLAGIPADPRAGKEKAKAPPQDKDKEKAKAQQAPAQQQAQERPQERPKAQQPTPKGKRPEVGKSEPPAEAPPETRVEAVSVPKLEPFEE